MRFEIIDEVSMKEFNPEYLDYFLGVVRKYMQLRGPYSQKELAEMTDVGVSTMSRFLNKKTTELNSQLIAAIVAKLNIPLNEVIDFVDEQYEPKFKRLVQFKKSDGAPPIQGEINEAENTKDLRANKMDDRVATSSTSASSSSSGKNSNSSKKGEVEELREKLKQLSLRQRRFLNEFVNLGLDERDLIVDVAEKMLVYFKDRAL